MGEALIWEKSSNYKMGTVDQDGLWKKIIGELFEEFILFFSPKLHAEIDFSVEQEFLQQELFKQIMDEKKGSRSADQIVKVRLKDGHEQWILIHIEVQSTNEIGFSERMFQYFYRIYDTYAQEIVAMAVMTSPYRSKYRDHFQYDFFGTKLTYAYNNYKLIDYDDATLKASDQIFSKIILAAKYHNATRENAAKRYTFKEQLMNLPPLKTCCF